MLSGKLLPVVANEIKQLAVAVAGIEVVLLHLGVGLIKVPVIVIESVYRTHRSGSVAPSSTVDVKLASRWVVLCDHKQHGGLADAVVVEVDGRDGTLIEIRRAKGTRLVKTE